LEPGTQNPVTFFVVIINYNGLDSRVKPGYC